MIWNSAHDSLAPKPFLPFLGVASLSTESFFCCNVNVYTLTCCVPAVAIYLNPRAGFS